VLFDTSAKKTTVTDIGPSCDEPGLRRASSRIWYNHDHRHSSIRYVCPAQRHDVAILAAKHDVYLEIRQRNQARWSSPTRD